MQYLCPKDSAPLKESNTGLSCAKCASFFPYDKDEIALLDLVKDPQAHAFDEQHELRGAMSSQEIERSIKLARGFLSTIPPLPNASNVLDIACGKGEVSIGLARILGPAASIWAFDHSVESLRVLAETAKLNEVREYIKLSAQDAQAMCFPINSMDLVIGNAVLHHFLEWQQTVRSAVNFLKPGGSAVFAEPFVEGYLLPILIFRFVREEIQGKNATTHLGLCDFIIQNISERIRNRNNTIALSNLTDKHLFTIKDFSDLSSKINCEVEFKNFELDDYYKNFLTDLLNTYGIENPEFRERATKMFNETLEFLGAEYPNLAAHFRYIVLTKH